MEFQPEKPKQLDVSMHIEMFVVLGTLGVLCAIIALAVVSSSRERSHSPIEAKDACPSPLLEQSLCESICVGECYTVRRFKRDDHYIEKKKRDNELEEKEEGFSVKELVQKGLKLVHNEEDI